MHVIHWDKPFNYSEINNMAAREAHGEILAFLNNDIKVIHPDWLQRLVAYAIQPETGAVGPKLLYPNGTIQHGGVVRGMGGIAAHIGQKLSRDTTDFFINFSCHAGVLPSGSVFNSAQRTFLPFWRI